MNMELQTSTKQISSIKNDENNATNTYTESYIHSPF